MTEHTQPIPGACDCHVHVIGPKLRFPLANRRSYTPMDAPLDALESMMARLGLARCVIIQPSIYGTDNDCTLDAVDRLGGRAKAVAVIEPETHDIVLDILHKRGVCGLRVNILSGGSAPTHKIQADIEAAARMCARNGWYVQAFVAAASLEALAPILLALPVPVVLDHFAMVAPEQADGPDADRVCRLLETGQVWVKLSGAYRITADPFAPSIDRLAQRFAAANPERLLWASDWPHTPGHPGFPGAAGDEEQPFRDIDTRGLLDVLGRWVGAETARRILVDNPATLHDFG
jgi:predicted TIM-barrel fold metal-dependent hydrolase